MKAAQARLTKGLSDYYTRLGYVAPGLAALDLTPGEPHLDPIMLPSGFTATEREEYQLQELESMEVRLRVGQGHDILQHLRRSLGIRSLLTRHTRQQLGVVKSTRSQENIKRAEARVLVWSRAYRRVWTGLRNLSPTVDLLQGLQQLDTNRDLMMLGDWVEERRWRGEGRQELPWIWTIGTAPLAVGDERDNGPVDAVITRWNAEGEFMSGSGGACSPVPASQRIHPEFGVQVIRLEWVHASAALERWQEEVILLHEEAKRTVATFSWDRDQWIKRQGLLADADCPDGVSQGFAAYAAKQAWRSSVMAANAHKVLYSAIDAEIVVA